MAGLPAQHRPRRKRRRGRLSGALSGVAPWGPTRTRSADGAEDSTVTPGHEDVSLEVTKGPETARLPATTDPQQRLSHRPRFDSGT